jgi:hypothetical protein
MDTPKDDADAIEVSDKIQDLITSLELNYAPQTIAAMLFASAASYTLDLYGEDRATRLITQTLASACDPVVWGSPKDG